MPIYMKYTGIDGQSKTKGFEAQIELASFQFGVGRGIGSPTQGNREASTPSLSEITVTKLTDKSSTALMQAALFGEGQAVVLTFTKTGTANDAPQTYLTITLTDALVSGWSLSSGGDQPTESVSINFTKIEWVYQETDGKNKVGKPTNASWNIETNTA